MAAQVASLLLSNSSRTHTGEANNNQSTNSNTQAAAVVILSTNSSRMDRHLLISLPTLLVSNMARTILAEARMVATRQHLAQEERPAHIMDNKVHQQDMTNSRLLSSTMNKATQLGQTEREAWEPWQWVSCAAAPSI